MAKTGKSKSFEGSSGSKPLGWMERAQRSVLAPVLSKLIEFGNIDPEKHRPREYRGPSELPYQGVYEPEINAGDINQELNPTGGKNESLNPPHLEGGWRPR